MQQSSGLPTHRETSMPSKMFKDVQLDLQIKFTPAMPVLLKYYQVLNGSHYPDAGMSRRQ